MPENSEVIAFAEMASNIRSNLDILSDGLKDKERALLLENENNSHKVVRQLNRRFPRMIGQKK